MIGMSLIGTIFFIVLFAALMCIAIFSALSKDKLMIEDSHYFRIGIFWWNRKFYADKRLGPAYLKVKFWFMLTFLSFIFAAFMLYGYFLADYPVLFLSFTAFFSLITILSEIKRRKRLLEFKNLESELKTSHLTDENDILQAELFMFDRTFKSTVTMLILCIIMAIWTSVERDLLGVILFTLGALFELGEIVYHKTLEKRQRENLRK